MKAALLRFVLLIAAIVVLPLVVRPVVASEIWIFAIAGMALNLIFGYTGMLSFGQATFFGLAAYTAGLMMIHWHAPLLVVLAAGTVVGALAAAAIGYVCIQRVGTYFIMLTFGFNQMFFFIAYKWTAVTGGDDGLPGIPRPPLALGPLAIRLDSSLRYYVFVAAVFLLAFYAMKRIVDSPLGVIFQSIRENPVRAAAVGYDVKRYKWIAFTIAGGFTGFAGVLYSMMFGIVPLESISWIISGDIVFMVLIGGIGNLYGPLLGAAAFKWLSEAISVVWERWPLILGVALVLVVLFLRGGLVEAFTRLRDAAGGPRAGRAPGRGGLRAADRPGALHGHRGAAAGRHLQSLDGHGHRPRERLVRQRHRRSWLDQRGVGRGGRDPDSPVHRRHPRPAAGDARALRHRRRRLHRHLTARDVSDPKAVERLLSDLPAPKRHVGKAHQPAVVRPPAQSLPARPPGARDLPQPEVQLRLRLQR